MEAWRWGYRRFESKDAREVLKALNVTAVWHETAGRVSRWGLERGMYYVGEGGWDRMERWSHYVIEGVLKAVGLEGLRVGER